MLIKAELMNTTILHRLEHAVCDMAVDHFAIECAELRERVAVLTEMLSAALDTAHDAFRNHQELEARYFRLVDELRNRRADDRRAA